MKCSFNLLKCLGLGLSIVTLLEHEAQAFNYSNDNTDAILCFRKAGQPNPFDLEVNIGSITTLMALAPGNSTNFSLNAYTTNQLATAMGESTFEDVKFSVTAGEWDLGFASFPYPIHTTWFSIPRTDSATQTTPFTRGNSSSLGLDDTPIDSLGVNATSYNSATISTATAIGIPPTSSLSCEQFLNKLNTQAGRIVENQAPDSFDSAIVSDLYIDIPTGNADPFNSNATSGNASYLGFFTFSPNGVVTFTRQNVSSTTSPAPTLHISSRGNTNVISFTSANAATYTLYFTNASGLNATVGTWPFVSTNITGNGSTVSFTNVSSDPNRFYRVKGH